MNTVFLDFDEDLPQQLKYLLLIFKFVFKFKIYAMNHINICQIKNSLRQAKKNAFNYIKVQFGSSQFF